MTAGDGLDREAIERRAEAATAGPWKAWDTVPSPSVVYFEDGASFRVAVCSGWSNNAADAEFIAHARTDVPALLAALRAAEAKVERWKRRTAEATWHGEYTMGRWAPEVRHADPCDCDEDDETAGEACMDNSEWTFAVFAAGGAFAERCIVALPRTPPEPDDDWTEPAFVLRTEGGAS